MDGLYASRTAEAVAGPTPCARCRQPRAGKGRSGLHVQQSAKHSDWPTHTGRAGLPRRWLRSSSRPSTLDHATRLWPCLEHAQRVQGCFDGLRRHILAAVGCQHVKGGLACRLNLAREGAPRGNESFKLEGCAMYGAGGCERVA